MLAALALDFLARPGSLARGERARDCSSCRGRCTSIRRRLAPYARLPPDPRRSRGATGSSSPASHARVRGCQRPELGVALRKTLEECGVAFIKLGQMASTRVRPVARGRCATSSPKLQASVAPEPREPMQAQLEAELGRPVDEVFAEFDWEPIGSASIAQAYAAQLTSRWGPVVVKIQRPGMETLVERDIAAMMHIATAAENRTPQGKDLHVTVVAAGVRDEPPQRARLRTRGRERDRHRGGYRCLPAASACRASIASSSPNA